MRKILLVVGSGTVNGNTDQLAKAFARGAAEAGHEVKSIFLGKGELHGCKGCGACQIGEGCVQRDIMQKVYPAFAWCDTLVLASPLYFWTISSQSKAFIDRLYAISRNDRYPVKDTALLMTAGDDEVNTFDIPIQYCDFIFGGFGGKSLGLYCAGGCSGKPGNHSIPAHHLDGAYEFGKAMK